MKIGVIGAGVAGTEAIKKAHSNGAYVKIIELSENRLSELKSELGDNNIEYIKSSEKNILEALKVSDIVVGAVYVVGKEAPRVVLKEMINEMKPGTVMVDISIDQGGCFETSSPTTHDDPTFIHKGIVHYCVTNMPGAVPLTASNALNRATISYIHELTNKGIDQALNDNQHLKDGLNIDKKDVPNILVREALDSLLN